MKPRRSDLSATILVAEDDSSQRVLLRHILSAQGYHVVEAADGHRALAQVCQLAPDLVITDYEMPGIDGMELVRTLRRDPARAGLPILMLTARTDDASRLAGLEAGVDDYLSKPCARAEVLARVRNLLRLRHALRRVEEQNDDLRDAMQALRESHRRALAAEKLAYLGGLAVGLCHELNNPLAVVRTNLAALGDYGTTLLGKLPKGSVDVADIADDLPALMAETHAACDRLSQVTEQLASLQARDHAQAEDMVYLDGVLSQAISAVARRSSTPIVATPSTPVRIPARGSELARCLAAILSRFTAMARCPVTATLSVGPSARDPVTLSLAAPSGGAPVDPLQFFDPSHVHQEGRVAFDFALGFARDVLANMGADIEVERDAKALRATLVFPTERTTARPRATA